MIPELPNGLGYIIVYLLGITTTFVFRDIAPYEYQNYRDKKQKREREEENWYNTVEHLAERSSHVLTPEDGSTLFVRKYMIEDLRDIDKRLSKQVTSSPNVDEAILEDTKDLQSFIQNFVNKKENKLIDSHEYAVRLNKRDNKEMSTLINNIRDKSQKVQDQTSNR